MIYFKILFTLFCFVSFFLMSSCLSYCNETKFVLLHTFLTFLHPFLNIGLPLELALRLTWHVSQRRLAVFSPHLLRLGVLLQLLLIWRTDLFTATHYRLDIATNIFLPLKTRLSHLLVPLFWNTGVVPHTPPPSLSLWTLSITLNEDKILVLSRT